MNSRKRARAPRAAGREGGCCFRWERERKRERENKEPSPLGYFHRTYQALLALLGSGLEKGVAGWKESGDNVPRDMYFKSQVVARYLILLKLEDTEFSLEIEKVGWPIMDNSHHQLPASRKTLNGG